jgi:hypothetical protein
VLVSPLRRALQTAYLLFKDHPYFRSIRFVVNPDLREVMHTVCDIPDSYENIIKEFKPCFPIFDLSLMDRYTDKNTWFIQDFQDPQKTSLL